LTCHDCMSSCIITNCEHYRYNTRMIHVVDKLLKIDPYSNDEHNIILCCDLSTTIDHMIGYDTNCILISSALSHRQSFRDDSLPFG
jgi:hypothetical protein